MELLCVISSSVTVQLNTNILIKSSDGSTDRDESSYSEGGATCGAMF